MAGAEERAARRREIAEQSIDPCVTSAAVVAAFWQGVEALDPQCGYEAMLDRVQEVRKGARRGAEATLAGQAAALHAIFVHMARRGQAWLDQPGKAGERYLRLALRAQAQCRATLNALAEMAEPQPEKTDEPERILRIERVIIEPGMNEWARREAAESAPCPAAETATEEAAEVVEDEAGADAGACWATNGNGWETMAYGARMDGGAARGAIAQDTGAQAVGAFDRTPYG